MWNTEILLLWDDSTSCITLNDTKSEIFQNIIKSSHNIGYYDKNISLQHELPVHPLCQTWLQHEYIAQTQ